MTMYVDTHRFTLDDNHPAHSINDLSRQDLVDLYRALATVPISPEDRLSQLRDTIYRFLLDNP